MSILHMAHFIPSMYTTVHNNGADYQNSVWRVFLGMMEEKYSMAFNEHVRKNHLNSDPRSIGIRCASLAGTVSSTNGLEKRGDYLQQRIAATTKNVQKEYVNVVHIVAAFANDVDSSCSNINKFAESPIKRMGDYKILRDLAIFDTEETVGNLYGDMLYMVCTDMWDKNQVHNTLDVLFQNVVPQYTIWMPTLSKLCSITRRLRKSQHRRAHRVSGSITYAAATCAADISDPNTLELCEDVLFEMGKEEQMQMKMEVYNELLAHNYEQRPGETLKGYARRMFNRNPATKSQRTSDRIAEKMKRKRAAKKKAKAALENENEKDKWSEDSEVTKEVEAVLQSLESLPLDDFDEVDLMQLFVDNGVIDPSEVETIQLSDEQDEIRVGGELGSFIEIRVDAVAKCAQCNCEDFTFDGFCQHVAFVEVLVFGMDPPGRAVKGGDNWVTIRRNCKKVLTETYVPLH